MSVQHSLYVVASRDQIGGPSETSLAAAAKRADLDYKLLLIEDVAIDDLADMRFERGDLLYRLSVKAKASAMQSALLTLHGQALTSIYTAKPTLGPTRQFAELFEQLAADLPIIPSRIVDDTWLALDDKHLEEKLAGIGGLPVLFKTLGLSHGQGVRKLDTLPDLRKAIQEAVRVGAQAIVREYLPEYRHYRLIVVDGEVIAAIEYHKPADDFRTNASETPQVTAADITSLPAESVAIAVRAVEVSASIVGGVDLLYDVTKQRVYLAEVNVPCNFSRAEAPTGVDIADQIIAALQRRTESKS